MVFDTRLLSGVGVLAAVVEAGNLVRAAEILGLTASGVSRSVARLEARVGVRLFDRNPRGVSLTEEGRRFYARVTPLLAGLDEAAAEAAGAASGVSGRLRVSVDPWFARVVLAAGLQRLPRPLSALVAGFFDQQLSRGHDDGRGRGRALRAAGRVRPHRAQSAGNSIVTVAAPAYLARCGEPQTPHDLVHHEAILFRDPQTGLPFPWEFHRGGEIVEVKVSGRPPSWTILPWR